MASTSRPYFPYVPRNRQQSGGDDFERGMQIGSAIGKLGQSFMGAFQTAKQNQVANQLLSQEYPDQPQGNDPDPDPIDPSSGAAITDPNQAVPDQALPNLPGNFQGGLAELQLRQKYDDDSLGNQIKKAQLSKLLNPVTATRGGAGGRSGSVGGASPWLGKGNASAWTQKGENAPAGAGGGRTGTLGGKPQPYVAGSSDVENDPSSDDFGKIRSDFDEIYGKGTYDKFQANFSNLKPDAQGNFSIPGKDNLPIATVPGADAPYWLNRNNAARNARGLQPIGPAPAGSNPTSGKPAGDQENPIPVTSNLQLRAVPFGKWIVDPATGQKKLKQPLAAAQ